MAFLVYILIHLMFLSLKGLKVKPKEKKNRMHYMIQFKHHNVWVRSEPEREGQGDKGAPPLRYCKYSPGIIIILFLCLNDLKCIFFVIFLCLKLEERKNVRTAFYLNKNFNEKLFYNSQIKYFFHKH